MSSLNLGDGFAAAVLTAAGLDPAQYETASVAVEYVPESGPATIRVNRVASIDAATLRQLVADHAQPAPPAA